MNATQWAVWSWDAKNRMWLAVAEGTKREMTAALERKRSAAARLMPSARFTMTAMGRPPVDDPEEQESVT